MATWASVTIAAAQQPTGTGASTGRGGRGGGIGNSYPQHAQADAETIARGKTLYEVNCSSCHGSDARGGEAGPNLLRSELVMDDQNGEGIAPVIQAGRPTMGMPKLDLSAQQINDIAAYIHSFRVAGYDISRMIPTNIVVGDPNAGKAFFNGAGKCNTCHSVTGDLAGIGSKRDPKSLQNAIVSGGRGVANPATAVTVTVTLANGRVYDGKLTYIDDFLVLLSDQSGDHLSVERSGSSPKVVVHNPLQTHIDMLSRLSDDDIHNLTAYLVTLK